MSKKFLYFAYGSNLLTKRLRLNNPSAVRNGIGRLDDYELGFASYSTRWKGAVATVSAKKGKHVWGSIWELDIENLKTLDEQEGVPKGIYVRLELDIVRMDGKVQKCQLYKLTKEAEYIEDMQELPVDRRPSPAYLTTILLGAKESRLPKEYIDFLNKIPHNGYSGDIEINMEELNKEECQ